MVDGRGAKPLKKRVTLHSHCSTPKCMKIQGLEWERKLSTSEKNLEKSIENKRLVGKYLANTVSQKKYVIFSANRTNWE